MVPGIRVRLASAFTTDDPRFRGVYLLFAQAEDHGMARRLPDLLVSHGAKTGDTDSPKGLCNLAALLANT